MAEYTVEVFYEKDIAEVFGAEIKKSAEELGILSVESVKVADLYRFKGGLTLPVLKHIAENILIDSIVQGYAVYRNLPVKPGCRVVEVWYREGVTDNAGETTAEALKDAGIKNVMSVRTGKKYYFRGRLAEKDIATISERILSNTLIHNYSMYNFSRQAK